MRKLTQCEILILLQENINRIGGSNVYHRNVIQHIKDRAEKILAYCEEYNSLECTKESNQ